MLKALKIRIYPNKTQQTKLTKLFGCYRFVYNKCLELKQTRYKEDGSNLNLSVLGKYFHGNLQNEYTFLQEHNTKVLKQAILNLLDSYKRFFKKEASFPNYKSKRDNQSVRFPVEAISKRNNYLSSKLTLTKDYTNLLFKTSKNYRRCLEKYKQFIKSATLSNNKSGQYFLSILIDIPTEKKLPKTNNAIGLDLGITDFVVASDGFSYENLKIKRNNQRKLKLLHRSVSKKQKGSKNRNKARLKLARFYQHLTNQKTDYLHWLSNLLLVENQTIVIETLKVKNMMKNHKLARSLQELSIHDFTRMLEYKSNWYGRELIKVGTFFPSSKLCGKCGCINTELTLKDRMWTCACGAVHNRDLNAARNILVEGLRIKNTAPLAGINACGH